MFRFCAWVLGAIKVTVLTETTTTKLANEDFKNVELVTLITSTDRGVLGDLMQLVERDELCHLNPFSNTCIKRVYRRSLR